MIPNVPVPVWEQIAVVIVFAFLLAGLGWVLVRLFTRAIADVNAHYASLIRDNNRQWQQYFDARAEVGNLISRQMLERMDQVAGVLTQLSADFKTQERLERQALDVLNPRPARNHRKEL
jgi:tRNA isopentenyl-2-thiomethyl-A-37 hydroxylase MiaE